MATLLSRGKPYNTMFTISGGITPAENDSLTINIRPKYSFTSGNSVIISGYFTSASRFEAIVDTYDVVTGIMYLVEITNIQGTFGPTLEIFTITLTGQRGSKILHGSGAPSNSVGRSGDMYIDETTGIVYFR